ncbi:neuronal acetylcholine receptor subunit beta-2-like [Lineus longissimus]|uniref:neuronal acetylcholine receptor subunit beta-2-like n=1 Tax=Lineus longissimus TaxID=88925 RepID=UPI00315D9755
MTYFPFDQHVCDVKLVSATLLLPNLVMTDTNPEISLDDYKTSTEWDVITTWAITEELPPLETLSFANLDASAMYKASIVLRRRSDYYVVHMVLPCVFMSLLVVLTFLIPSEAGEKVSFSVTILLAFTVYQTIIVDTLPRSSDTTPVLSIYLTIQVAMSSLSVVASMLVLNVHHHDPQKPVTDWTKTLVYGYLAAVTFQRQLVRDLRLNERKATKIQVKQSDTFSTDLDSGLHDTVDQFQEAAALSEKNPFPAATQPAVSGYGHYWKVAAAILDRFFLFLFLLVIALTSVVLLVVLPKINNY